VPRDDIARVWYKEAITRVIASEAKQSQQGLQVFERDRHGTSCLAMT